MSKRRRIKEKKTKALSPEQLETPDQTSIGRRFAEPYDKARLLIDHPHSYREWNIVGRCDVPGFFYLESRFRLNFGEQLAIYTAFELCLHESQFERVADGKDITEAKLMLNADRSSLENGDQCTKN